MKRKLLVLAVAGAFAAPAAMAADGVSIYGAAGASVDITNDGAAAPTPGRSANKVSSNESYIGFKASHDLSGGMSVVAQVESGIALDGTAAAVPGVGGVAATAPAMMGSKLAGRDSFLGLTGGFGTVLAGTHDTPYKMATRGMDVFANTIADNRALTSLHDIRLGNVLAYVSPKIANSTTIVGAVVMGGENGATGAQTKGSAFSLAGMYNSGAFNGSAAYQTVTVGTAGTGTLGGVGGFAGGTKLSALKIGGSYAVDQFVINAVFERPTISVPGAASVTSTNLYVGAKYNVSNADAIKAAYGKAGSNSVAPAPSNGASQISLGYDHAFDKTTTVYVLYTKVNNDKAGAYGLGQTMDGEITGAVNGGLNSSPTALSAGMRYTF